MTDETPKQRITRLARERKRAQRKREKDKRVAMGAKKIKIELYRGTQSELEQIRIAGGLDETEHVLTMGIHGLAELSRRDPVAFRAIMKGGKQ